MNQTNTTTTSTTTESRSLREVFDLRDWMRVFSAHLWWMIIITTAVLVGTVMTTFTATPFYQATQRLLIERESDKVLKVSEIYDISSGNSDYYLTQYNLLESRAVAKTALELLPAADREWFARNGDPVDNFMRLRRVVPIRNSRLVDIFTEHPEPKIAEFMALAIFNAYVQNHEDRRRRASSSALKRLREDARILRAKMLEARRVTQDYKARYGIVSINDHQSLAAFQLEALTKELAQVDRELSGSRSNMETANRAVKNAAVTTDLPEVLQNKVVSEFKVALLDFSSQLSRLEKKYKPKHPRIIEQRSKVDAVQRQLDREVMSIVGSLQHKHDRLKRNKADVEARIAVQNKVLQELDGRKVRFDLLSDEAENTKKLYESVVSRLKEVEVIENYTATNVHPVGDANVTHGPVRPRTSAAILIALLAGFLLSAALAFVLDAMDNSIKSSTEAERVLGVPVLGIVPRVRGVRSARSTDAKSLDPTSNVSEAFRTIRTSMMLSENAQRSQSLVVTSTGAGEGKSLVALNTAVAFARAGHRVLLVDAEMRRPRLHHALEIHSIEGFSSVLAGERNVDEVAFETSEDNLYFMPCGILPPNPLELLTIGLTASVRRDLFEFFDLIVFDSPPIGLVSDAQFLASIADQVLFVVRTFKTDRARSQRAIKNLRVIGANIAGLIINHVDSKAERGRHLEFTYESAYASEPTPRPDPVRTPQSHSSATANESNNAPHTDDLLDDQLNSEIDAIGAELEDAIGSLGAANAREILEDE